MFDIPKLPLLTKMVFILTFSMMTVDLVNFEIKQIVQNDYDITLLQQW